MNANEIVNKTVNKKGTIEKVFNAGLSFLF